MEAEGISFVTGAEVDAAAISETVEGFDATVLAIGSTVHFRRYFLDTS